MWGGGGRGRGLWVLRGREGGRYRRGPGGAAAATIRDDGVGGWGEGGVVAVVCGGLEVSGEFGGEEGAWGVKVCGLWGKLERKSNNDGKEGRAGNGKVWEY